ncbi:MAG TPA: TIR domain-containing protein [Candidatus Binatia bacterium]|nr:TIR domain-containing protein [Candidatus Binatia bacterium]
MSDIFISYASEDRDKAEVLAEVLSARGWSVWWDRKIPLGMSYDEVIEKALGESKCAIVLWSAVSAASEWVRNEASEAKRRGILVPVFLETIDAPLAFRLLNGADLHDWEPGRPHGEFDQLIERVAELLGKPQSSAPIDSAYKASPRCHEQPRERGRSLRALLATGFVAVVAITAAIVIYFRDGQRAEMVKKTIPIETVAPSSQENTTALNLSELEKALQGLAVVGGSLPATAVTTAFHIPDLGLRVAFIGPQQNQAVLGSIPSGALVMEVESSGAASKAGIHVFDVIEAIGGHEIETVDDLRQSLRKLGAGKSQFIIRSPNGRKTVTVDCPKCKPE